MSSNQAVDNGETWATYYQLLASDFGPNSAPVRELIDELVARDVRIDTTIGLYIERGQPPAFYGDLADRLPPLLAFRLRHRLPCAFCSQPTNLYEEPAWKDVSHGWLETIGAMHAAGVQLLIGSDYDYPQEVLHSEMRTLVEGAGIPPREVLQLATIGAARAAGQDHELGSISVGKLADLILVAGDPTQDIGDIHHVRTVIQDGIVYRPSEITRFLGIAPSSP
jgi:hypothetical protein